MILRHRNLLLALLLAIAGVASAASRDPGQYFFQDTFGNLRDELATAREEGKQGILLFFEQEDCPFCHRMKHEILNQPDVQDYFRKHFRIFSIDIEGDVPLTDFNGRETTQKDFAFRQHRVRATPVIAFFDLDGKRVMRYTGAVGDKAEFMLLGKFVAEGHYRTMRFTRYKRQHRKP